ncbi:hypothetical protein MLD38_032398 [Melastoma candidum]|uniref:Uncharacterized protein n=1 Tax=Melastoma candidum TaxID=119954 RepID=A0ACB9M3L4_9MYRT|nr:hypothetical protein MLD38_032398 [Melastoma candidum]
METSAVTVLIVSSSFVAASLVYPAAVASTTALENTTFAFPTFYSDDNRLRLQGNATMTNTTVQLTAAPQGDYNTYDYDVGRAVYYQPVRLRDAAAGTTADFTTRFTFSIYSLDESQYAEGLAFFLMPQGSEEIPTGTNGSQLGLVSENTSSTFIAVEIDTFSDDWDPQCIHLGIDLNNLNSMTTACANCMDNVIRYDGPVNASISYNSSTQSLVATLQSVDDTSSERYCASVQHEVNLAEFLPENVLIGFSAATGFYSESHTLHSWEWISSLPVLVTPGPEAGAPTPSFGDPPMGPSPAGAGKKGNVKLWVILSTAGASALVILVGGFGLLCRGRSKKRQEVGGQEGHQSIEHGQQAVGSDTEMNEELQLVAEPKKFYYAELADATDHFADSRLLGKGGFGCVYGGYLSRLNRDVAIKKIDSESQQGVKEYITEVRTISRVWHKNLVQLLGWCHEDEQLLIVYEFMPNRSLDFHLFNGRNRLTWDVRYNIAKDIASAISYLHEECKPYILHRDIKASNIMLDQDFAAKLGDFGLAKLVDNSKVPPKTTAVAGTLGYLAPEYIYKGRVSKDSDVYSFGVVLLEIACGRKARDLGEEGHRIDIVEWVWKLHEDGKLLEAADPNLDWNFDEKEMECLLSIGLWCTNAEPGLRPSILEVRLVLDIEAMLPVLTLKPPVPTYLPQVTVYSRPSDDTTSSSRATTNSNSLGTVPAASNSTLPQFVNDY